MVGTESADVTMQFNETVISEFYDILFCSTLWFYVWAENETKCEYDFFDFTENQTNDRPTILLFKILRNILLGNDSSNPPR